MREGAVPNIFQIPELRSRILFTLGALAVYRVGGHIPTPGIDTVALAAFFQELTRGGGTIMQFFDLFTGIFGQSLDLPSYVSYISRDVHFDNGRARSVLRWAPVYLDLRDAVREMVAWYVKRKEQNHGHA